MTTADQIRKILDACACAFATHDYLGRVRIVAYYGGKSCTVIAKGKQFTADVARLSDVTTPNDERDVRKRERQLDRDIADGKLKGFFSGEEAERMISQIRPPQRGIRESVEELIRTTRRP